MSDETTTCGKGLAANAVLPEKISALLQAMADLLENHTRSLDRNEPNGKTELDAYAHLVREQRAAAGHLSNLTTAMRGYRDLAVAGHNETVLVDQKSLAVFAAFIAAEEELTKLLENQAKSYRTMLDSMSAQ
jgi:hypothetical protein